MLFSLRAFQHKLNSSTHYEPLEKIDEEAEESKQNSASPIQRHKIGLLLLSGLIVVIGTITFLGLFQYYVGQDKVIDQCGHTHEEARALGCFYEITSFSWVPEECYDREIEAEFLASRDWKFWRDMNGTQEVSIDEVKLGEARGFFVPWEFHTGHCGYLFKKLHRAMKRGGKVDSYIWDLEHTDHCVDFMLDPPAYALKSHQFTFRKFPFCGREGGLGVDIPESQKIVIEE